METTQKFISNLFLLSKVDLENMAWCYIFIIHSSVGEHEVSVNKTSPNDILLDS